MVKTAVVILNWNGQTFLEQFLPLVVSRSTAPSTEIWVADNGSTDSSVELLTKQFPTVRTLLFDKNYGFTGGYNKALSQIEAEYFVLLNSDIEVTEGWLEPMVDYMDQNPKVAACMPKLLSYHQPDRFEYAGAVGGYIDKYGYPFCRGRIFATIENDNQQYNHPQSIFWATGACLFVRGKLYKEIGGLDEDFFAHMEEIDLCWRLKNMGYKLMVIPQSVVYHVGGGTLPNNSPRKLFLNYRNNLFMLYKNLPSKGFWTILLGRLILDGVSGCMFLAKFNFAYFCAIPKAHFHFYKNIGRLNRKRSELQSKRIVDVHAEQYQKSIVVDYYLKRKKVFSSLKFHQ